MVDGLAEMWANESPYDDAYAETAQALRLAAQFMRWSAGGGVKPKASKDIKLPEAQSVEEFELE